MTSTILAIVGLAILGALARISYQLGARVGHPLPVELPTVDAPRAAEEPLNPDLRDRRMEDLELEMERLKEAVAHGITQVSRNENRIQKTVTSARRLVREAGLEHAGIEAEYEELQPPDAEGIQPLPAVPAQVETNRVVRFPGGSLEIGAA